MKRLDDTGTDHSRMPVVYWSVYQLDGRLHAVADVPQSIPKTAVGFGATDTTAVIFVGSPNSTEWPVRLPVPVNPLPDSISYNNGVVEAVFSSASEDQLETCTDSTRRTA